MPGGGGQAGVWAGRGGVFCLCCPGGGRRPCLETTEQASARVLRRPGFIPSAFASASWRPLDLSVCLCVLPAPHQPVAGTGVRRETGPAHGQEGRRERALIWTQGLSSSGCRSTPVPPAVRAGPALPPRGGLARDPGGLLLAGSRGRGRPGRPALPVRMPGLALPAGGSEAADFGTQARELSSLSVPLLIALKRDWV